MAPPEGLVTPRQFGAAGDGAADDTVALQRFFAALRDGGFGLMDGTHRVDRGALVLEPSPDAPLVTGGGYRTQAAPKIHGRATLVASGRGSGPLLTVQNPLQKSNAGTTYGSGALPVLHFVDRAGQTGTDQHGLSLRGCTCWTFDVVSGLNLPGSTVYMQHPLTLLDGRTAVYDPYDCSANVFLGVEHIASNGYAVDADTLIDDGNIYNLILSNGDGLNRPFGGAYRTRSQGSRVATLSCGLARGWAVQMGSRESSVNRMVVEGMEIDACEFGLWIAAAESSRFSGRVIFDPVGDNYSKPPIWPLVPVRIGGVGRGVVDVEIDLMIRIDKPTTLDLLPPIVDFANEPFLRNVVVRLNIHDEAGLGVFDRRGRLAAPVNKIAANLNPAARVKLIANGQTLVDTMGPLTARATGAGRVAVPTRDRGAAYLTASGRLRGWTPAEDPGALWDADNAWFSIAAPATRWRGQLRLALPVGSLAGAVLPGAPVRMAIVRERAGALTILAETAGLAAEAFGAAVFECSFLSSALLAGDRVWASAEVGAWSGDVVAAPFMPGGSVFEIAQI